MTESQRFIYRGLGVAALALIPCPLLSLSTNALANLALLVLGAGIFAEGLALAIDWRGSAAAVSAEFRKSESPVWAGHRPWVIQVWGGCFVGIAAALLSIVARHAVS